MATLFGHPLALFSVKVELLAAEAGRTLARRDVEIFEHEHHRPEYREVLRLGRIPVLVDEAVTLGESNAILRYLAGVWDLPAWYPPAPAARAAVDQWLDFGLVHVSFPLSQLFVYRWLSRRFPGWPMDVQRCTHMEQELARYLPAMERQLAATPYLAGAAPTLADLALVPFLAVAAEIGIPLRDTTATVRRPRPGHPAIAAWLARMTARPAFSAAWDPRLPDPRRDLVPDVTPASTDCRQIDRLLAFWFDGSSDEAFPADLGRAWFEGRDPALDGHIATTFGPLIARAADGRLDAWQETPRGTLALVLLLDQFPRHVHRGTARAYAHDGRALAVCLAALARGVDAALPPVQRAFLYLPLQHAERLDLQERAVECYARLRGEALGTFRFFAQARQHRAMIARFGRFPHRNAALGRPSTPEETRYLAGEAAA
jgi:uncharacterized protein (DUF924 family)/glutathione S-transferase